MTKDDIIRIAVQCQLVTTANRNGVYMQALFDFAALVAAAEREACAKEALAADDQGSVNQRLMQKRIAAAIRARGQAT